MRKSTAPVRWGVSLRLSASFAAMASLVLLATGASLFFFVVFREAASRLTDEHLPGFSTLIEVARRSETVVAGAPALAAATDDATRRFLAKELSEETSAIFDLIVAGAGIPSRLDLEQLLSEVDGLRDMLRRLDRAVEERIAAKARQNYLAERSQGILRVYQGYLAPWLTAADNAVEEMWEHPNAGETAEEKLTRLRAISTFRRTIMATQHEIERLTGLMVEITTAEVSEYRGLLLESRFEHVLWRLNNAAVESMPGADLSILRGLLDELGELGRGENGAFALWRRDQRLHVDLSEILTESRNRSARLSAFVTALVDALRLDAQQTVGQVDQTRSLATKSLLAISVLALVASFCLAWFYVRRGVVLRIKNLVRSVVSIAAGDLQTPIDTRGDDEIAIMANALTVFRDTAREVDAAHRLAARESGRLAEAIGILPEGFLLADADGVVALANARICALLPGVDIRPGRRLTAIYEEGRDGAAALLAPLVGLAAAEMSPHGLLMEQPAADGRWLRLAARRTGEGGLVALWADITEAKRREADISAKTELLKTTLETIGEGIAVFNADMELVAWNQAFFDLHNFPDEYATVGAKFEALVMHNAMHGEYGPGDPLALTRTRVEDAKRMQTLQFERVRPNGVCLEIRGRPMPGGGFVITYTDITRRHAAENDLRRLAETDALTGLANRAAFMLEANDRMHEWLQGDQASALLFMDLDGFKDVNDTYGHPVGDCTLVEIARRMKNVLGDDGLLGRFGGDEFVALLQAPTTQDQVRGMAARIIDAVSQPVQLENCEIELGVSIGVAGFPFDGRDTEALLRRADIAMYQGKAGQRNSATFFNPQMEERSNLRRQLLGDLRHAVGRGELELYYQPQVSFVSGMVVGVEALMRWRHPDGGQVPPSLFIPIAEESGLIAEIGEWALITAADDARRWAQMEMPPLEIAINLSAVQFAAALHLKEQIGRILEPGLDNGSRFVLEITESILMKNLDNARNTMYELVESGIQFAIDDFGTGYSSLSYLKQIPVQQLKIDRSFIVDLDSNADAAAIVGAVVAMAGRLNLATVAEGVETASQFAFLQALGCNLAQGYYCARPMPIAQFETWMIDDATKGGGAKGGGRRQTRPWRIG